LGTRPFQSDRLTTFEQLDQNSGFVLYETQLPKLSRDPSNLVITELRDRALVYVDDEFVGALSRENYINTLPISAGYGSKLSILVENQGRINFQIADDYKVCNLIFILSPDHYSIYLQGILGSVRVQIFDPDVVRYQTLRDWTITGFPFENHVDIESLIRLTTDEYQVSEDGFLHDGPVVFHGEFEISQFQEVHDTYWDPSGWGKGFVFVNGMNLGRYWPLVGPQITMYIPKDALKHGRNEIQIVELQKVPMNMRMSFVNGPIFINEEQS
jgi:beta-galactosidase